MAALHAILALRCAVFVVEQGCPYLDVDGRDPAATHHWVEEEDGAVLAYLRVLPDPQGARIGRVVTAPVARGRGLAARLMEIALAEAPGVVVLDAQAHLAGWYTGFGFARSGPEFMEDGIPHVPMRRPPLRAERGAASLDRP